MSEKDTEFRVQKPGDHWRVNVDVRSSSVTVGIDVYDPVECALAKKEGRPFISGLRVIREGGRPPWYVRRPNWLERLFGMTLKSKVISARKKAEKICQNHNDEIRRFAAEAKECGLTLVLALLELQEVAGSLL